MKRTKDHIIKSIQNTGRRRYIENEREMMKLQTKSVAIKCVFVL